MKNAFWTKLHKGRTHVLLLAIFLMSLALPSNAQRVTRQYNNVSLSEALKDLNASQDRYAINFVYNDLEDFRVKTSIRNMSVPDAIIRLIGFYPIKMTQLDNNIMVECTQKTTYRYKGRVVDERGNAAEYASIALLSTADSTIIGHGVSNEDGSFVIPCNHRKVIARVTYVGYKTIDRVYNNTDMGTIQLHPETKYIKGVVVKGHTPIVKAERGVLSYNMPLLLKQLPADNAYEALTRIPGVSDVDGDIKFSGNDVTLIIDGQATTMTQSQLADRLKAMPAAQLAKAEVMLAAPARYHVRGMAINIETKKHVGTNQLSGQVVGSWKQSRYGLGLGQGNLSLQRGKFGLDALYSFYAGNSYGYIATEANQLVGNERVPYEDITSQKAFSNSHKYRLGASYAFANDHRLDIAYTGQWRDGNANVHSHGSDAAEQHTDNKVYMHNVDINYELPFGLKLSGAYTFYRTPQQQKLDGTLNDMEQNLTTRSRQTIDKWMFAADQSHTLGHGLGLSYGMGIQLSRNNSFQTTVDKQGNELPDATSSVNVTERIWNMYVGINKQITKAISIEASLTAEQYHSPVWDKWHLYPSLNALWKINANNVINLSASSNSQFPTYWSIMSGVYYTSIYKEVWGNPNLKPFSYYNFNLMWQYKQRYTFMAFASFKPNNTGQQPYQPSDRLAVVFQEVNYDYSNDFGVQASAMFSAGKWLNGNAYAVGRYQYEKCSNFFDLPFDRKKLIAILGGTASVKLCGTQDLRLIVNPFFMSKSIQGLYDIQPIFRMSATLQWNSRDGKWGLRLIGNNVFNTKYKSSSVLSGQDLHLTTTPGWASATLSLVYKFGGYKEKKIKAVDTSRMGH